MQCGLFVDVCPSPGYICVSVYITGFVFVVSFLIHYLHVFIVPDMRVGAAGSSPTDMSNQTPIFFGGSSQLFE